MKDKGSDFFRFSGMAAQYQPYRRIRQRCLYKLRNDKQVRPIQSLSIRVIQGKDNTNKHSSVENEYDTVWTKPSYLLRNSISNVLMIVELWIRLHSQVLDDISTKNTEITQLIKGIYQARVRSSNVGLSFPKFEMIDWRSGYNPLIQYFN